MIFQADTFNYFPTRNTALAAWLYMRGFELIEVQNKDYPTVFIYKRTPELLECLRLFQTGEATGNIVQFFDAYRRCLSMIRVGKL